MNPCHAFIAMIETLFNNFPTIPMNNNSRNIVRIICI